MIFLVILMGIIVVCASCLLGFVVYKYFEVVEEFRQQTPVEFFMQEYHKIRNTRLQSQATK